ncbi:hypothetical protein F3Y22_tig00110794pilonHSYRG00042 [Hibiscus syriacus]|uniref:DUF4283 domain-containing protein n=1 Tax=Hibiscus syriacus TaxID=106335 RepID=A0A6A2ZQ29_HIBSY|nr:hypothetical protein F3Y22_tig00110794pilonHSYRG00042 [Hibiscus syriacus]
MYDTSLEWPGSPVLLENQQLSKKGRSELSDGVVTQVSGAGDKSSASVMEIEGDVPMADGVIRDNINDQGLLGSKKIQDVSAAKSYATTLVGGDGLQSASIVFGDEDMVLQEGDVQVDRSESYPVIKFSNRVHDSIDYNMRRSIIVRLLGKNIGYRMLLNKIKTLWQPQGRFQLIDLDNGYHLVRLELESGFTRVLTEGPWVIFGSYLIVQPWSRNFSTTETHPSQVVVWIVPQLESSEETDLYWVRV